MAGRMLLPGYSEIDPVDDLIWDNTNKALASRADILNLHRLDDALELKDYEPNFRRLFGNERMDAVLGSVGGRIRFHGLTPTSLKLEGLDRHPRLLDSYRKAHVARAKAVNLGD
jgi:hypothetical protein